MDIGAQINQYQVVEHIGRGGMADVWSARDTRLNRMVAIKTIAHGLSSSIDPITMFKQEAQTIAQMEHPHILPIYDFGEAKGKFYIVMRFMAGGSLNELIERGAMPLPECLRIGKAVAQALDHAHSNKIVHLDIKPQNVLLDTYQSPYLADFGLATVLDQQGRARNPGSGTLMYMAPEQVVADVIDYRADIYSFAVVMYHMLSGRLPYNGKQPLALRQIQFQEGLPHLDQYPINVTEILRRATAVVPTDRPASLTDFINELAGVFVDSADVVTINDYLARPQIASGDADLLEAADIYNRARQAWAGGQGRFLLGVTHFMLMSGYYTRATQHGLPLDNEGQQMLLRGALEYDHDLDYWWAQLEDADRRWVCLHAIRSGNAPARIRALYRLETLPDENPPRIPRLVAQALQIETDEQAKLAALQVLGTRARLMKPNVEYEVKSEYRGRLLSTVTRLDVQMRAESSWQEAVYSPEIDLLLANIALDQSSPTVAEFAARVIGRVRSLTAVRFLAAQQRARRDGALRALAYVRDEAPSLPPVVSPQGRSYAWLANSWRRLTEDPLALTWRFLLGFFGSALGMGLHIWIIFPSLTLFSPQRYANALSFGLAFGFFTGLVVLFAEEFSARLRGFWSPWGRFGVSAGLGLMFGMLNWWVYQYMFLNQQIVYPDILVFGGFGLAFGFVLNALLNLRAWFAIPMTALGVFLPMFASWNNVCWQSGYCVDSPPFSIAPAGVIGLSLGLFVGVVLRLRSRTLPEVKVPFQPMVRVALAVGAGLMWAVLTWLGYALIAQTAAVTWTGITAIVALMMIVGAGAGYLLDGRVRVGFSASAVAAFAAFFVLLNPLMQNPAFTPSVLGESTFLTFYNNADDIFSAGLPFAIFLALGGHALLLRRDFQRIRAAFRPQPVAQPVPSAPPVTPPVTPSPIPVGQDMLSVHTVRLDNGATMIDPDTLTTAVIGDKPGSADTEIDINHGDNMTTSLK